MVRLLAIFLGVWTVAFAAPAPRRVLILTGQNNHAWADTTPQLVAFLEAAGGRFTVDVSRAPLELTADLLSRYAVLVSNWNTFGANVTVKEWPESVRRAYVAFVRNGGGHVVVHAGSSSFPDWPEYQEICLATWKMDQTAHGPRHRFKVRPEADHPVTAGLAPTETQDELWVKPGVHPRAMVVLAAFADAAQPRGSGAWEPSALAGRFGAGRTFALLLGHDVAAMQQPVFRPLFVRAVEWAASGKVTFPASPSATPTPSSPR